MKIHPVTPPLATLPAGEIKTPAAENKKNSPLPETVQDRVIEAQQALREMPEVDLTRIDEMKTAIADGRLPLDSETLSNAILDYYRQ